MSLRREGPKYLRARRTWRQLGRYLRFACFISESCSIGCRGSIPLCNFVCLHSSICSLKSLQGELLDICLPRNIINDGIVRRVLGFDLVHVSAAAKILSPIYRYLFELVHQGGGVFEGFGVAIVKAFGEDLIDDPVFACKCQQIFYIDPHVPTPICYHGLCGLELRCAHDESGEVCGLQFGWDVCSHYVRSWGEK